METVSEVRTENVPASATPERMQAKPFATAAWNFLISMKLAIWILIVLAVTSILGTVVEQNQPAEKYRQVYEDWAYNLMDRISLFDMYHSWWFLLLLCLFTINLTCCTIDRLPRAIRTVRKPKLTLDDATEKSLSLTERWKSKGDIPHRAEEYKVALARAFAAPKVTEADGAVHLYAEKGVSSRFGAYATHAGIVIVFIGAIIGNVFGFKSYVNIPDGKEASHLDARGGKQHIDLPFSVRNNRFWLETYPGGQPKKYASDLSVMENGREVLRKTITVNDPLVYKGVWFYQSSYGQEGEATALVSVRRPNGSTMGDLSLAPDEPVPIDGYGTIRGVKYSPNLQGRGPALQVVVEKPGKPAAIFVLFQQQPDQDRQRKDALVFSFGGLNSKMFTGLQVAKDPGVNVVWLGCLLLTAGMMVSFFLSHRRIWIRLANGPHGKMEVTAGGTTNRNRPAFEKTFASVLAEVRNDPSNTEKENPA
ncbi:MAG: cytochrome c biogenesis protein ResB [Deltaproteobacteria bacterium]|nr:cytochrome c biogenesis protein ResB [Candidatus Deferrimicrobium borealis]